MPEVTQEHAQQHQSENSMDGLSPGRSFAPPAFQLQAGGNPIQRTKDADLLNDNKEPKIPKTQKVIEGDLNDETKSHNKDMKIAYGAPEYDSSLGHDNSPSGSKFRPEDVYQGSLGDCYFMASLVALAKSNPTLLENAITDHGDGTYTVQMYEKQLLAKKENKFVKKNIKIKASFPRYYQYQSDVYAKSAPNEDGEKNVIWAKLFEKAYAKMKGGYKKINGGLAYNAFEALTGKPYKIHMLDLGKLYSKKAFLHRLSDQDLATKMMKMHAEGEGMTAATKDKVNFKVNEYNHNQKGFAQEHGIIKRHVYAVIGVTANSVTLRNPHGSTAKVPELTLNWEQFRRYFECITYRNK